MSRLDYPYEASDEASETELLDRSLSVWKGYDSIQDMFKPIALDLHTACSIGHYETVNAFIKSGKVDLNQKNKGSWTPLMYASYISHDNIVNLLLDAGVRVDEQNHKGTTAFMLAASCGNESVCYFLLQQGARIDQRDRRGWTALFYATNAGHQTMVQFLLDNGSETNVVDFHHGITLLMMASAEGHEIIVNKLLEHGVHIEYKSVKGDTARSLGLVNGHMKVVSLIDNRTMASISLRSEPGLDLSSSDENIHRPYRTHGRTARSKAKGPSIRDGPEAVAKMLLESRQAMQADSPGQASHNTFVPSGYVTFEDNLQFVVDPVKNHQVIPPINPQEHELTVPEEPSWYEHYEQGSSFCTNGDITIKSSCSSSLSGSTGGLAVDLGIGCDNSLSSNEENNIIQAITKDHSLISQGDSSKGPTDERISATASDPPQRKSTIPGSDYVQEWFNHNGKHGLYHGIPPPLPPLYGNIPPDKVVNIFRDEVVEPYPYTNLSMLLESLNLSKYYSSFEEQDVDLRVFLTLSDTDLKEIGIKLLGPRKKMTNAIARKHSQVRPFSDSLEQAYADRVEAIMQEMAQKYQQLCLTNTKLEAQVLEERELRSVAEGCLMEDRTTWQYIQDLVMETWKLSHNIRLWYDHVRTCQSELFKRLHRNRIVSESTDKEEINDSNDQRRKGDDKNNMNNKSAMDLTGNTEVKNNGQKVGKNEGQKEGKNDGKNSTKPSNSSDKFPLALNIPEDQDFTEFSFEKLVTTLNLYSYQMGRVIAMATNNMDKLTDGHQVVFSPNSSGNSLP